MYPEHLGTTALGRDPLSQRPEREHLFDQELPGHCNDHVVPIRYAAHANASLAAAELCVDHCDLHPNGLETWPEDGPHAFNTAESKS